MENLELYNKVREVPQDAKKTISAGRIKGFTDINPMWRIKCLTEQFGPCGSFSEIEILPELIFQNIKTSRSTISIIKDSQYLKCNFFRMLLPLIILIYACKSVYPDLDHLRSAWYEYLQSLFQVPLSPETDSGWCTRHFRP